MKLHHLTMALIVNSTIPHDFLHAAICTAADMHRKEAGQPEPEPDGERPVVFIDIPEEQLFTCLTVDETGPLGQVIAHTLGRLSSSEPPPPNGTTTAVAITINPLVGRPPARGEDGQTVDAVGSFRALREALASDDDAALRAAAQTFSDCFK